MSTHEFGQLPLDPSSSHIISESLQLDVARVEAQDQEVVQRNNALNKQQAALQTEV